MRVSVVIPTYNAARTIRGTLDSVLRQSSSADEILVLDDGSTDETVSILRSYGDSISLLQQKNSGVAAARNTLCAHARGDLIAFLDHDDLWHPAYLETQQQSFAERSDLVASFTGHVNFHGYEAYEWTGPPAARSPLEIFGPVEFLTQYNLTSARFGSASFLCMPKAVLEEIGSEPFQVSAADDAYLCTWLPLLGSVGYAPAPRVAYRIHQAAQSTQKLKAAELRIAVIDLMEPHYKRRAPAEMWQMFQEISAAKRRHCAKHLLGVGRADDARRHLRASLERSSEMASRAKSLGLLAASYMPPRLQPRWPTAQREWQEPVALAERAS
jgi:GT2 family glycosyltransferase